MDIKIKTSFDEKDNNYQGYIIGSKNNNVITYDDENINVAIIIKSDKITLTRKSSEYKLELSFDLKNDTEGTYTVHSLNQEIKLNIKTSLLNITENKIEIKYLVNTKDTESYFKLEYEVLK